MIVPPQRRTRRRRRLQPVPLVSLLFLLGTAVSAPAADRYTELALEAGAGVFVPFDGEDRDVFGVGSLGSVGLGARLSNTTWLMLETGAIHASGQDYSGDPTFETEKSSYWVYPVTLGFRVNTSGEGEARPVRLYLGFGVRTLFTTFDAPFVGRHDATTVGLVFEMRPEFSLGARSNLYVRHRFLFGGDGTYGGRVSRLHFGGSSLDFGLSYRFRRSYVAEGGAES